MTLYLCFLSTSIFKVNPEAAYRPAEASGDDDSSSCMNCVAEKLKAMEDSYQSLLSRLEVTAVEVLRVVMCMIHVLVVHVERAVILLLCSLHLNLYIHVHVHVQYVIMYILNTYTCVLYRGTYLLMTSKRKEKTEVKQQGRGIA